MDLPLLTKSLAHVNVAPSGPDIMATLILVIHASKFEIMEKLKDKLSFIKLSVFLDRILSCTTITNWVSSNDWPMLVSSNISNSLA